MMNYYSHIQLYHSLQDIYLHIYTYTNNDLLHMINIKYYYYLLIYNSYNNPHISHRYWLTHNILLGITVDMYYSTNTNNIFPHMKYNYLSYLYI